MSEILVTGASSVVGRYLLPMLAAQHHSVIALSRREGAGQGSIVWRRCDIGKGELPAEAATAEVLIHLAPLPLITRVIDNPALVSLRRIVGIGTTSIFTKSDSGSVRERAMMASQQRAEAELVQAGARPDMRWTLLRPTLVYDGIHDKNVARITSFILRFGFFPMVKPGSGIRQPLHAADLAWACVAVMDKPITEMKAYNLGCEEALSYRQLVERIFLSVNRYPRIIMIPTWVYRRLLAAASLHPRYRYLDAEMAGRMNHNMEFDIAAARHDFGFSPRSFLTDSTADHAVRGQGNP